MEDGAEQHGSRGQGGVLLPPCPECRYTEVKNVGTGSRRRAPDGTVLRLYRYECQECHARWQEVPPHRAAEYASTEAPKPQCRPGDRPVPVHEHQCPVCGQGFITNKKRMDHVRQCTKDGTCIRCLICR